MIEIRNNCTCFAARLGDRILVTFRRLVRRDHIFVFDLNSMDGEGACKQSLLKNVIRRLAIPGFTKDRRIVKPIEIKNIGCNVYTNFILETTHSDEYRSLILEICEQQKPMSFEDMFPKNKYVIQQFDSGTYADVYKAQSISSKEILVLKIIRTVSKHVQKRLPNVSFSGTETFDDVYNELVISKTLTELHEGDNVYLTHSFPRLCHAKLVEGLIPHYFTRNIEEGNIASPQRNEPYAKYTGSPLEYVVLVMKFGGEPIWKMIKEKRVDGYQLLSIAKQVTFAIAVAEENNEYEHRDLHISNILVKPTKKAYTEFILDGNKYHVETCGYRACIVDHTFSRLTIDNIVIYKDMADILMNRHRDEKPTLQNEVYKSMVDATHNEWQLFCPKTNVLWLQYLYQTLLKSSLVRELSDSDIKKSFTQYSRYAMKCNNTSQLLDYIIEKSCHY